AGAGGIAPEKAAEAVVEGTLLGLYRFHELRTQLEDARPDLESLTLVDCAPDNQAAVELGVESGRILAESTVLARNLINRPANVATPSHIVETARAMAADVGLACRVMEKPEMEARGMHSLLSVNQGGGEPARMVILQHNGDREELPTITLVGKGITFDSGGISLKPGQDMWKMKGDMGGAAAVIGAMRAVALLNLPLRVIGLTPLTENMPDAFASKPGDVVKSLKGLTIEIISTDAEGRMILADALTYSGTFKPDAIVDVATLTGSKVIALGAQAAAVMGDDTLIEKLRAAGNATFERVWPMPMYKEYAEELKSDFADVKHVGSRAGGCITAGVFLSKFPPDGIPWAHLDIAGHAFAEKDTPYVPKGAVGFGVRLLVEMLRSWD
ncbi:MAG: leucyl aminopeptidase, partial [Anaerolineae bacterium]|nr:leucyl aminopeptidase [Anaerolineae bacterium]